MTLAGVSLSSDHNLTGGQMSNKSAIPIRPDGWSSRADLIYRFGRFELWPDGTLLRDSAPVAIPPKELAILRVLLKQAGRVVPADELRSAGWGSVHVSADSLPRCISSLRTRFDAKRTITTVYKCGYRFEPPVAISTQGDGMGAGQFGVGQSSMGEWNLVPEAVLANQAARAHYSERRAQVVGANHRLVIMPFQTAVGVPELFGARIAEETMLDLSRLPSPKFEVLAYDSVSALHKRGATAVQVGLALSAGFAVAGTVVALPVQYRLRAEMFRVADLVQLWVHDFLIPRARLDQGVAQVTRSIGDHIQNTLAFAAADPKCASNEGLADQKRIDTYRELADLTSVAC